MSKSSRKFQKNFFQLLAKVFQSGRSHPLGKNRVKWINFRVDNISQIKDRKFSRGLNFANQPIFHLISLIFLEILAKIEILKISRKWPKFAKINPREI